VQRPIDERNNAIRHIGDIGDAYHNNTAQDQVRGHGNEGFRGAGRCSKSTELNDQFVLSHIQLAVAQYKSGKFAKAMVTFSKMLCAFPTRSEPQNYFGELVLDQGNQLGDLSTVE
jgi:mitochondrial import receptor subunit TOM70